MQSTWEVWPVPVPHWLTTSPPGYSLSLCACVFVCVYLCNFVFLCLCFSGLGKVRGVSEQFLILSDWPHLHQRQRPSSRVNPAFIWSNFLAHQCYSSSDISVLDHFRPGVIVFQDIYLHLDKPQKLKPLTYIPNSIKNTVVVCLLPNIEWSIVQRKRTCCLFE